MLRQLSLTILLIGCGSSTVFGQQPNPDRKPVVVTDKALEIHRSGFVFDGHNDLPWAIRTNGSSSFKKVDISKPQPRFHTDIDRLRKGNVGAQFWSVYVPSSTMKKGTSLTDTVQQIDLVKKMVERYPETFHLALSYEDILEARKAGKIASLIGIEGGHSIENSIQNLRRLFKRGARYMTLTHSDTLDWADSATDEPRHDGLSLFGEEIVREMNRLGMLVDISHVSPATMKDTLATSQAPVIFSHSSARAVADHVRNVPDEILKLTRKNRGVVMVNFFSGFIEPESARRMSAMFDVIRDLKSRFPDEDEYRSEMLKWRKANPVLPGTVHDLVDHIDHIVKVAGVDSVGIGSDYDGVSTLPFQLEDVSTYPVVTQELLNRGYSKQDIHKIMSGNILRVIQEAEKVSRQLSTRK
ncbi:MAG: dipeptidase [Planctomycetota bacterium]|nr:dipeptidase [Planctomycetota bacterium]